MKNQLNGYKAAQRSSHRWRDEMVLKHYPLVKRIALRIANRLPDSIEADDLISVGVLGLFDALEKFDPEKRVPFEAYAARRIRGAILDELRNYDFLSRGSRRKANDLDHARHRLQSELGRDPNKEELSQELDVTLEQLHGLIHETRTLVFLDIEDCFDLSASNIGNHRPGGQGDFEPYQLLENKTIRTLVIQGVTQLPQKLLLVMSLYYKEELNYKEIGQVMEVSESRVSQLHKEAVEKLRKYLKAQELVA